MGKDSGLSSKKRKKEHNGTLNTSTGRKRKAMNSKVSSAPTFYQEYCELPFTLSTILVDEFDCITQRNCIVGRRLHVLPAKITVKQVLQHYQRKRGNSSNDQRKKDKDRIRRFCDGLALLFDDALPVCLLYQEERPQYDALQRDEDLRLKRPCEIYGSTFLLRLLQRLPTLLRAEPQKEMDDLGPMVADLIVLLQKNRQACFKESYRAPEKHEQFAWEIDRDDDRKENDSQ